jgi:hypothetical protein
MAPTDLDVAPSPDSAVVTAAPDQDVEGLLRRNCRNLPASAESLVRTRRSQGCPRARVEHRLDCVRPAGASQARRFESFTAHPEEGLAGRGRGFPATRAAELFNASTRQPGQALEPHGAAARRGGKSNELWQSRKRSQARNWSSSPRPRSPLRHAPRCRTTRSSTTSWLCTPAVRPPLKPTPKGLRRRRQRSRRSSSAKRRTSRPRNRSGLILKRTPFGLSHHSSALPRSSCSCSTAGSAQAHSSAEDPTMRQPRQAALVTTASRRRPSRFGRCLRLRGWPGWRPSWASVAPSASGCWEGGRWRCRSCARRG